MATPSGMSGLPPVEGQQNAGNLPASAPQVGADQQQRAYQILNNDDSKQHKASTKQITIALFRDITNSFKNTINNELVDVQRKFENLTRYESQLKMLKGKRGPWEIFKAAFLSLFKCSTELTKVIADGDKALADAKKKVPQAAQNSQPTSLGSSTLSRLAGRLGSQPASTRQAPLQTQTIMVQPRREEAPPPAGPQLRVVVDKTPEPSVSRIIPQSQSKIVAPPPPVLKQGPAVEETHAAASQPSVPVDPKLVEARRELDRLHKEHEPDEASRDTADIVLTRHKKLQFVAWERKTAPGEIAVYERGAQVIISFTPNQFLQYIQAGKPISVPVHEHAPALEPSNAAASSARLDQQAVLAGAREQLNSLDAATVYRELKESTQLVEALENDQVESAFKDRECKCPKNGAVSVGDKYLHANRITNADGYTHIAAQAPQSEVARERFWKTAANTEGHLIVDLTNDGDLRKSPPIEENYPKRDQSKRFGSMLVTCTSEKVEGDITTSTYQVQELGPATDNRPAGDFKTVTRINYRGWHDFSGADAEGLKTLITLVDDTAPKETVPIVHCRAGVGRSGTFITARTMQHLSQQVDVNGTPKIGQQNFRKKMDEIILHGRQHRGPWFVQTEEQVETLLVFGKKLIS